MNFLRGVVAVVIICGATTAYLFAIVWIMHAWNTP